MKLPVYRALGKESSFFGISESYLKYFLIVLLVGLCLALAVGRSFGSFGVIAIFTLCLFGDYFLTLYVQSKYSVKDLGRFLASKRLPKTVVFKPVRLDMYISRWNPDEKKEL